MHRILRVSLSGRPVAMLDQQTVEEFKTNTGLVQVAWKVYYLAFDDSGVEKLYLYEAPADGESLKAQIIFVPADLVGENDALKVPALFHQAPIHYAAAEAFGAKEDNPEMEAFFREKFEAAVADLRALRISRAGRGPVQMRVQGVHW